jgi:hypothetical protein
MKTILLTLSIALQIWMVVVLAHGADIQSETSSTEFSVAPTECDSENTKEFELIEKFHVVAVQAPMCPSGQATCRTFACGANGLYCCPASHPYLSHCDCQCYNASPDCQSYSACSR